MDLEKFRKNFLDHCQTTQFRTEVKSIIRDETFFKDLVRDLTSHQHISNQVNDELKSKLPYEVERVATPIVESKLNLFTYHKLPQLAALQINAQLNNHGQMNDMFNQHSTSLKTELEVKSNEIMTKVVNESKYHTLSNKHFAEIDRKNDTKMSEINLNLNKRFDLEIRNEVKTLQTRFDDLQYKHNVLATTCVLLVTTGFGAWVYHNNNNGKRF